MGVLRDLCSGRVTIPDAIADAVVERGARAGAFALDQISGVQPRTLLTQLKDGVRFEHAWIIAAPGSGKSVLFERWIAHDMKRARKGKCSLIVMDGSELIDKIIRHADLAGLENVILIDPACPASMPQLNLFGHGNNPDPDVAAANAIGTFLEVMGGLLNNKPSPKMQTLLSFLAQVMARHRGATLDTLRQIMANPDGPHLDVAGMPDDVVEFFRVDMATNAYRDTCDQLNQRLRLIASNPIIRRLLVNPEPTVDLVEAINAGSIILVETRKSALTSDGCRLLGKFIIAALGRAVQARVDIEPAARIPAFFFADEVQDYLLGGEDPPLAEMFDQARKFKVGLHIAHQNMGQIGPHLGRSILTARTKVIGRVSAADAMNIGREIGMARENHLLTSLRPLRFYVMARGVTNEAISLKARVGGLKKLGPDRGKKALDALRDATKERYAADGPEAARASPVLKPEAGRAIAPLMVKPELI